MSTAHFLRTSRFLCVHATNFLDVPRAGLPHTRHWSQHSTRYVFMGCGTRRGGIPVFAVPRKYLELMMVVVVVCRGWSASSESFTHFPFYTVQCPKRVAPRTPPRTRTIVAAVPHYEPHQDDNFLDKLSVDEINDWGGKPPTPLLDTVNYPVHLKNFNVPQLRQLCKELRADMIHTVSRTGGHLGSSLGVTELTVALHYVFNTPEDKIIWDVGHQAYVHKMLTGRRKQMSSIRQTGGLSGVCFCGRGWFWWTTVHGREVAFVLFCATLETCCACGWVDAHGDTCSHLQPPLLIRFHQA